jgi:hypothetical protein
MFAITGQVQNVFSTPSGTRKDGTKYESETKVQIMGTTTLSNGEPKMELVTLSVPPGWAIEIKKHQGKQVTLPCSLFASGGVVKPFIHGDASLPENLRSK